MVYKHSHGVKYNVSINLIGSGRKMYRYCCCLGNIHIFIALTVHVRIRIQTYLTRDYILLIISLLTAKADFLMAIRYIQYRFIKNLAITSRLC